MAKYDSNWWFGSNSLWAQTGAKEKFTGVVADSDKGDIWGGFAIPTTLDISKDLKVGLVIIGGMVAYKLFLK